MRKTNLTQNINKTLENLTVEIDNAINLIQYNIQKEKQTETTHIINEIITTEIKHRSKQKQVIKQ